MEHNNFRYEQVVSKIEEMVSGLHLQPGDKVPSVRKVSEELKVSLGTVNQAYAILSAKGIITSKPGSGYYISSFNKNGAASGNDNRYLPLPEVVEVSTMATTMAKNTRKYGVINFSSLAPPNEFIPVTRLNKALQSAMKEAVTDSFQYSYLEGHPRLLKQIALHTFDWKNSITSDELLITNGCMEAINLCLDAITKPGDIVAVESPCYAGLLQCLESKGLKALGIRTDPHNGLDLDELEHVLSSQPVAACIFMPVCQNPIGCSMSEENKIRLVKMLSARGIPFIEDDALGELNFNGTKPLPAKAYDQDGNVLYCSSVSKSLSAGFRIGWVAAGKYQGEIEKLKFAANISTNGLLQDAISRFMESGNYNDHLKNLRLSVQEQVTKYRNAISKHFPEEVKISAPVGGYSLWIELPQTVNTLDLLRYALKKGIGFCPGQIFAASNFFQNFIRINCCPFWSKKIDAALKELGKLINAIK